MPQWVKMFTFKHDYMSSIPHDRWKEPPLVDCSLSSMHTHGMPLIKKIKNQAYIINNFICFLIQLSFFIPDMRLLFFSTFVIFSVQCL